MHLNVASNKVSASALVYAPGTTSANAAGFATIGDLLAESQASLLAFGLTVSPHVERSHQEAIKTALDKANNNLNFVQPNADNCPYTFSQGI
jgi:hypothetical protein